MGSAEDDLYPSHVDLYYTQRNFCGRRVTELSVILLS
jgi:hypothetical protein